LFIRSYIHTFIRAYVHTFIHSYIQTCIHNMRIHAQVHDVHMSCTGRMCMCTRTCGRACWSRSVKRCFAVSEPLVRAQTRSSRPSRRRVSASCQLFFLSQRRHTFSTGARAAPPSIICAQTAGHKPRGRKQKTLSCQLIIIIIIAIVITGGVVVCVKTAHVHISDRTIEC
jgi:hypothetical protein